jgi:hypothetical protein
MKGPHHFSVISKLFLVAPLICSLCVEPAVAAAANPGLPDPDPAPEINVSDCNIQAAIDNCVSSCTIVVSSGTCFLSTTLNWAGTGKKINLECASRQDTVLMWPAGVIGINLDSYARIAHCDLRGPKVRSLGDSLINSGGMTDVVIEDNIIEESAEHGINTGGNSLRWTIRDNLIQNNLADGIFLASGTSDSIVADNVIIGNGFNGIDCNCSGTAIHGNISKSNGVPGGDIDKNGILVSGISNGASANYNSVVGNETSFNGGSGISIRADFGTTANFNVVSGNVSHDNGGTSKNGDGIQVDGSDMGSWSGNTIVGNSAYNNQRYGIEVDGQNSTFIETTLISSNTTMGNGNTGILFGGPRVADTLVVDNISVNNIIAQINDNGSTRAVVAGNKENTTDSFYLVHGTLVADAIKPITFNPPMIQKGQTIHVLSAGGGPAAPLNRLGLDRTERTIPHRSGGPRRLFSQISSGVARAGKTGAVLSSFPESQNADRQISKDGTGLKHQLVRTGLIQPGSSALIRLNWATAFADGNYDPQCNVADSAQTTAALRIHHLVSIEASSITALIVNDDVGSSHFGTLYCLGVHH